ncbi:MAG: TonB-dependent receptor [Owenweeksia sp.]
MRKFIVLLLLPFSLIGQEKFTLNGYIREASTGEELIGVNILVPSQQVGTVTNEYGYYSLSLPAGKYNVQYQYIGYQTVIREIDLSRNVELNIELKEASTKLDEVEISDERIDKNVTSVEMSVTQLDTREIQKVPQLLGETDIIRTLTLLPGITTVGEGANGFNVRGGAADQNLILLDEGPVYNSSHLFGFFSIFNADAVKDVKVYKGGIPANYGGRLSSVIDVRQKEGNSKHFAFNGGLGLLSSRLLIESPIVKDKASFMVAARRSYLDIFLKLSSNPEINQNTIYFYDLNTKINWRLGKKDRLFLSGYFGRDVFGIADLFGFDWGNTTGTLRWNHVYNERLFSNTTFVYSDYTYNLGTPEDDAVAFTLTSRIQDYHLKSAYNFYISPTSQLDYGIELIGYQFNPGKVSGFQNIELQQEYALEPNAYISHEKRFGQRFTVQYGLRYSSFYKIGKQKSINYTDPDYPTTASVIDTTYYDSFELIKSFNGLEGLEPRLSVNYLLDESTSLKASYNRTRQYIHLISNTTSPTPVDLYRSAGRYIDPATVHQYALGYFRNFADNTYEASIEVYYKDFINLVDYRPGANLIFNEFIETELLTGIGRAYGAEFLLRKQTGKLTGWIGYTYSKSERKVDSPEQNRTISGGDWYAANYDKRHDLSIVANYQINPNWDVGSSFVFQTGRPITLPEGRFQYEDIVAPIYNNRNNGRVPNYHRLDISATYTPDRVEGKRFYSSWNFGIYNVYGRRNAYSIYFQPEANAINAEGTQTSNFFNTQAVRLSIFAIPIPFVTWNFNF